MQTKANHIQLKFFKSNILYQKCPSVVFHKKIKTTSFNHNLKTHIKYLNKSLNCTLNGNHDGMNESFESREFQSESVVLWFKNDLRIDDHPGLLKAIQNYHQIIPFYSLDPDLIKGIVDVPGGLELLYTSLSKLKSNLKRLGSDLIIKIGPTCKTLIDVTNEYNLKTIITEKEIDHT